MSDIAPTIGRKVHFFPQGDTSVSRIDEQPIDATVIYVLPRQEGHPFLVNLSVTDHMGHSQPKISVPLIQDGEADPEQGYFAKWMPFQIGQAKANAAAVAEPTGDSSAAFATPQPTPAPTVEDAESPNAGATVQAPETGENSVGGAYGNDFAAALSALKSGKAATRKAWGPNVFIYFVPAASYKAQTGIAKKVFGEDAMVPYMAYLAIKRADGQVCVFNPGIDSILAEDWEISQ